MRTVTRNRRPSRHAARYTLIAAAAFMLAAQASIAQEAPPPYGAPAASQNTDPPGRVARLNYTAGAVTTEPAGATDWSYAQINRPLTTGDQLWNDQNARSEMHIGSTAVRMGALTSLDILNLDDNSAQLKVTQGTLSARVRTLPPGASYEIDTPNLALGLNGPGDYRVDVAPDGSSTTVTVRSGSATVYGENGQVPVSAGQQVRFAGTALQEVGNYAAPGLDSFDQWAASRDVAEDRSVSARYVSRDVPGYEDLDANGTWRDDPQYGEVWVPGAVPAGWAPYHDGHWVWQAPWGWTWIDDAPWGFAPYHYGRWAYVDDSWAWVPGPVVVSAPPVYAPALVAFVGSGGGGGGINWGVSLAIGGVVAPCVAWFPLGPGESWHPGWNSGWSPRYYERVNQTVIVNHYNNVNVTNIHNTYINYRTPGGVTAVPATAFVHGQPTGRFAQKVDPQQWRNAQINPGGPGIAPVRESFGPGMRNANYRPPAGVAARTVVATRNPAMPAAYHDSLAQRFAQGGGRVPGAGEPIVRTSVPAQLAGGQPHGGYGMPMQNVRVVQSHEAGRTPGSSPGAPQQAAERPQPGNSNGNGVPHPPQESRGMPNGLAQQHGTSAPAGQQATAGRHEPEGMQPHAPMVQQQRGAPERQAGREAFAQSPGEPMNQPQAHAMPQQHAPRPEFHPREVSQPVGAPPRAPEVRTQPRPQPPQRQPEFRPPQQVQAPRPQPQPQHAEQRSGANNHDEHRKE